MNLLTFTPHHLLYTWRVVQNWWIDYIQKTGVFHSNNSFDSTSRVVVLQIAQVHICLFGWHLFDSIILAMNVHVNLIQWPHNHCILICKANLSKWYKHWITNSRLTELPIFARASFAFSTLESCLLRVKALAMCEQNSTDIPIACKRRSKNKQVSKQSSNSWKRYRV